MPLKLGGVTFPIASPGTGGNLLASCEPFLNKALPFFKACINSYFETAYVAAMANQAIVQAGSRACAETTNLDPGVFLASRTFKFPLLSIYPTEIEQAEKNHNVSFETFTTYDLIYLLPEMPTEQATRILPLLSAVYKMLVIVCERQGDPAYNSNERVWAQAGIEAVKLGKGQFVFANKGELAMPGLKVQIEVCDKTAWVDSVPALQGMTNAIDTSGDPDGTLVDAVIFNYPQP
jgi:hypothetical protein